MANDMNINTGSKKLCFSDEILAAQLLRYSCDKVDQQIERKWLKQMVNALKCTKQYIHFCNYSLHSKLHDALQTQNISATTVVGRFSHRIILHPETRAACRAEWLNQAPRFGAHMIMTRVFSEVKMCCLLLNTKNATLNRRKWVCVKGREPIGEIDSYVEYIGYHFRDTEKILSIMLTVAGTGMFVQLAF